MANGKPFFKVEVVNRRTGNRFHVSTLERGAAELEREVLASVLVFVAAENNFHIELTEVPNNG